MGVFNNIQNALHNRLSTVTGLPTVFYPNESKEPSHGTNYVKPTWLPARSQLYTLNNENYHQGIFQVDIYTQLKKGTAPLLLIADAIKEHFDNQSLTSSSTVVHIQEISISQARRVESWWNCYVEINYICVA